MVAKTYGINAVKNDWRNERSTAYARRHREWGWDCCCTDIDSIETESGTQTGDSWAEYDSGKTAAVIETKRWPYEKIDRTSSQCRALVDMARPDLPVLGVEWYNTEDEDDVWAFRIHALNDAAVRALGGAEVRIASERTYVQFLHNLRGRKAPDFVLDKLTATQNPRQYFNV